LEGRARYLGIEGGCGGRSFAGVIEATSMIGNYFFMQKEKKGITYREVYALPSLMKR